MAYGREVASFKAGSAVRQAIRELVLTRLSRLGLPIYSAALPYLCQPLAEQMEICGFFSRYLRDALPSYSTGDPGCRVPGQLGGCLILLGTAPLIPSL